MRLGDLTVGSRNWVNVAVAGVGGRGRLTPRLSVALDLRTPNDRIEAELRDVRLQLLCDGELLGEAQLIGERASSYGRTCVADVPVTRQVLEFVTHRLANGAAVDLEVTWYGVLRVRWEPTEGDRRVMGDPEPGVWTELHLASGQPGHHWGISRSEWYDRVLQPTGGSDFLYLEIAIPRGAAAEGWRRSLSHLDAVDKAYVLGDDAAVFQHLRAALDALPGAKKHIVDELPEPQRTAVDSLMLAIGAYLHLGRHVATEGDVAGAFPVDRQAANFAIGLVRVLMAYLSQVLKAT